jgi:hypothetical protein
VAADSRFGFDAGEPDMTLAFAEPYRIIKGAIAKALGRLRLQQHLTVVREVPLARPASK